jgi:PEP-CTERM motif
MVRATRMAFAASVMGAMVLMAGTPGYGATLVYEPFDYTGDQLIGQTASATSVGLVDPGAWTGTAVNSTLSNDGVSLGGIVGYTAGLGSRFSHSDTGGNRSLYRDMDMDLDWNLASDNTMYFSYLLERGANRFFDIKLNASSERIILGSNNGGNLRVRMSVGGGTLVEGATADGLLSLNTTYLIIGKVVTHADSVTSDEIYAKAYAAGSTVDAAEPAAWDVALTSGAVSNQGDNINNIRIYAGNTSGTQQLDEFRLGTDWDSVLATIPVPEPGSSVLMGLAAGLMAIRRNRSSI